MATTTTYYTKNSILYVPFGAYTDEKCVWNKLLNRLFSFPSPQELETRIDTQKQTLQARDESIKKLLEMLQSKGEGKLWNEIKCDDVIVGSGS